jgi:hypothetical protein
MITHRAAETMDTAALVEALWQLSLAMASDDGTDPQLTDRLGVELYQPQSATRAEARTPAYIVTYVRADQARGSRWF